ncbi:GNAT family N-acetyltransferase [Allosalinactinospora lopnorensis]|uniref:GNAT family N-acetyltransferase n=1 Tax=Allosalinactinospora lopnorensis TaxID=1352348 RepID=UPI000623CDDA|nr:GNAT family N-acetyltransferase [Allosalinactinospora lopnorensis]
MSTAEPTPAPTLPATILQTERLTLRAFTEAEVDSVYEAVRDPGIQRWLPLPGPGEPYTRADAEQWCLTTAPEARVSGDGQQWAAIDRGTDRFVGSFGLTRTMWPAMRTEVGYWVAPWMRGQGFAPEAVTAVSRWAIDQGFQRVELKAAAANTASRRVAEKTGFRFEGVERNAMPLHEGRTGLAVYSLIPDDLG